MNCPTCSYQLQSLSVTTTSGGKFSVDHCGRCGGTWFDPYEINRIPYHEITRLSSVTVLPKNPIQQADILHCPRDHKQLDYFRGESVPSGVAIHRCIKCLGIWATQKALEKFKIHQEEVVTEYKISNKPFPALSMVFAPAVALALLLISTAVTLLNFSKIRDDRSHAQQLITNLQIQNINPGSIMITFQTRQSLKSFISFGQTQLDFTSQTISSEPKTNHFLILNNLKPKTVYLYQITLSDDQYSFTNPLNQFNTVSSP